MYIFPKILVSIKLFNQTEGGEKRFCITGNNITFFSSAKICNVCASSECNVIGFSITTLIFACIIVFACSKCKPFGVQTAIISTAFAFSINDFKEENRGVEFPEPISIALNLISIKPTSSQSSF